MREMEANGLVDIQSHAMTHTWYFTSPKIVDIHRPREIAPYPWLFWNERPERKPYYLTEDQQTFLPWGYPVFEHDKALVAKRYFPDVEAVREVTDFVERNGGPSFFEQTNWRSGLLDHIKKRFDGGLIPGVFEAEDERFERIKAELECSKRLIEQNLDKEVDYICWPGGANDELVQKTALHVGYRSWTLDSRSKLKKRNRPGQDPVSIKRMGTTNQVTLKGRNCGKGGAKYQLLRVIAHQRSALYKFAVKAYKILAFLRSSGGSK
jgi:hypothetical protein